MTLKGKSNHYNVKFLKGKGNPHYYAQKHDMTCVITRVGKTQKATQEIRKNETRWHKIRVY